MKGMEMEGRESPFCELGALSRSRWDDLINLCRRASRPIALDVGRYAPVRAPTYWSFRGSTMTAWCLAEHRALHELALFALRRVPDSSSE